MDAEIGNRIGTLIEALGIKKVRFAECINIDQSYVTQLTSGKRKPSDRTIADICREFNVNEIWLRTGKGKMFNPESPDALEQLARKYKISSTDYVIIEKFLSLRPETRKEMFDYFREIVAAMDDDYNPKRTANPTISQRSTRELTREELHAELDRQLDEEKEATENALDFGHGSSGTAAG